MERKGVDRVEEGIEASGWQMEKLISIMFYGID
jgi:hypothetical protein